MCQLKAVKLLFSRSNCYTYYTVMSVVEFMHGTKVSLLCVDYGASIANLHTFTFLLFSRYCIYSWD